MVGTAKKSKRGWEGAVSRDSRIVTHLSIEGIILEVLAHDQGKHGSDRYIGAAQPPRQASKSREGRPSETSTPHELVTGTKERRRT